MSQYLLLFVPVLDLDDRDHLSVMPLNPTSTVPVSQRLYADATPEALSHALASGWPSGAVMSAEAGAVFGAHGMGYETIMRNLALLNVLWDGGEIAIDRRSKPRFRLHDRRLTFGLMVQPEALRGFLERAGHPRLPGCAGVDASGGAVRTAYPEAAGHATVHACRWRPSAT